MTERMKISDLSELMGVSNSEVEKLLSSTINKIVHNLLVTTNCSMIEISVAMIEFFGMDDKEYVRKLNANHLEELKNELREKYHLANREMEKSENKMFSKIFSIRR